MLPYRYYHTDIAIQVLLYRYYYTDITMQILQCKDCYTDITIQILLYRLLYQYYYADITIQILLYRYTTMQIPRNADSKCQHYIYYMLISKLPSHDTKIQISSAFPLVPDLRCRFPVLPVILK